MPRVTITSLSRDRAWRSGASSNAMRVHRWVIGLFAAFVLLQRFCVPGMTNVSLLLPVLYGWCAVALYRGVVEFDAARLALWLLAAGTTAIVTPLQMALDPAPIVSISSWGLLMVQFLPATLRVVDRDPTTYRAAMAGIARVCTWLASLSVIFMASQLVAPYEDLVAKWVPSSMLLAGFNTSYPLTYGATLYKSNAWVCLEASFLSYIMAVGLLAAVHSRARLWRILWLLLGLFTSASGSGFAILAVALLVLIVRRDRDGLKRLGLPILMVVAGALCTPFGLSVLSRVGEIGNSRSSGSVRTFAPYTAMWPTWRSDGWATLLGRGAGASQRLVTDTGIPGLLNPTLMKVFFDYGVLAGFFLFALIWALYLKSPSMVMAVSIGVSMWTLQTANVPFVVCVYCVITLWSPTVSRTARDKSHPLSASSGSANPCPGSADGTETEHQRSGLTGSG